MIVGVGVGLQFDLRGLLDGADHCPELLDGGDGVSLDEGIEPRLARFGGLFGVVVERPWSV